MFSGGKRRGKRRGRQKEIRRRKEEQGEVRKKGRKEEKRDNGGSSGDRWALTKHRKTGQKSKSARMKISSKRKKRERGKCDESKDGVKKRMAKSTIAEEGRKLRRGGTEADLRGLTKGEMDLRGDFSTYTCVSGFRDTSHSATASVQSETWRV